MSSNPITAIALKEIDKRDARIAELEAALRSIVEEAGPQFGHDDPPCGTIDRIAYTARNALERKA